MKILVVLWAGWWLLTGNVLANSEPKLGMIVRVAIDGSAIGLLQISAHHQKRHPTFFIDLPIANSGNLRPAWEILNAKIDGHQVSWQSIQQNNFTRVFFGTPESERPPGRYQYHLLTQLSDSLESGFRKTAFHIPIPGWASGRKIRLDRLEFTLPNPPSPDGIALYLDDVQFLNPHLKKNGNLEWTPDPTNKTPEYIRLEFDADLIDAGTTLDRVYRPLNTSVWISVATCLMFLLYARLLIKTRHLTRDSSTQRHLVCYARHGPVTLILPPLLAALFAHYWAGLLASSEPGWFPLLYFTALLVAGLLILLRLPNRIRHSWAYWLVGLVTIGFLVKKIADLINLWYPLLLLAQIVLAWWLYRLCARKPRNGDFLG